MILKQYYLGCLSHASYLIADEKTKTAAIVDPQRDIEQYVADAEAAGLTIEHVVLTHFHADFVAGHLELRDRTGATIYLGSHAQAEYPFTALTEGDVIEFGDVRLQVLETPGHTPEGISIVVYDTAASDEKPKAVLTGDTLFIGDVGRPDLLASLGVTADELADMLYVSLAKLVKLPDETLVYPAHGAGSMCGKNLSSETVSTMGEQKRFNYALQPMSREEFKSIVLTDQPDAPDYFVHDAIMNRSQRVTLEKAMQQSLRGLSLEEFLRMRNRGAQVLDTRDAIDFEGGHLTGALNIGLTGKYATWCGTMLDHERTIIVIGEAGTEEEAIMRLGRIGFDNVGGYLKDGMEALENRPDLVVSTPRVTAVALAEQLQEVSPPLILDVRTAKEWSAGHIAGSLNIPLSQLRARLGELPADRPIVVHCEGGYRSAVAASLLSQMGRTEVSDMVGGFKAWMASRLPSQVVDEVAAAG